jgi:hypothetical protein
MTIEKSELKVTVARLLQSASLSHFINQPTSDSYGALRYRTELIQPTSDRTELIQPTSDRTELIQPTSDRTELIQPTSDRTLSIQPTSDRTLSI